MDDDVRIENKIDRIIEVLGEHSILLIKQGMLHEQNATQLEHHIARTNLLEKHMEAEHKEMKKDMKTALLPINSIKWLVPTLIGAAATLAALKSMGVVK